MKLFLNWNGKNAIVAAAIGYASMTMSSVFTSSSSSLGGQQQQGVGFVLYVAAQKICECYYCTDFGCFGSGYDCKCPNPLAEEGCCPTPKPTDAPSSIPSSTPTNAPSVTPVFECKADDDKITLEKNDKKITCEKINRKNWCDEKVKDEDGETAAEFCTSCGCGESPVPSMAPTPSPPDEDCTLEDDDLLKLTTKNNEKTCAYINTKGLCDDPVENQDDKTAADFCISCGVCDGDPVPAPTPSPPDEDCKGDKDKIKLTNQEKLMTTKNNWHC